MHRRWGVARTAIHGALADSDDEALTKRAAKLEQCCQGAIVRVRDDGTCGVTCARCRDRICPLCSARRSREASMRTTAAIAGMDSPKHLVLTAPAVLAGLDRQMRHIREAMKHLRRRELWKERCRGGVYTWEITRNAKTGRWHPHVHLVIDAEYMEQRLLVELWREALQRTETWGYLADDAPCYVWINAVHSRGKMGTYIGKYISKPQEVADWPPEAIREYAAATRGVRMLATFGNLHGTSLDPRDPNEAPAPTEISIGVLYLDHVASTGAAAAVEALACIQVLTPWAAEFFEERAPPELVAEIEAAEDADVRLRRAVLELNRCTLEQLHPEPERPRDVQQCIEW